MTVHLTPQAQKDLNNITQKDIVKIIKKLRLLEQDPTAGKRLTGKLKGFSSLRAWPYRIIYEITHDDVWVAHIMHRKDVYK
ncbi:MAG: type II toxin-antitoxin system RelE/ParE family toxin [bacterium]|nr:type II toxin-antitoxin system RelE/ParE family toxin [bacterium]